MELWNFIQASDFTMRIVFACACAAAGLMLLRMDRGRPQPVVPAKSFQAPKLVPVAASTSTTAPATGSLTTATAYERLWSRINEASERTQRMNSCQVNAGRHIDVAETALRRLADEIADVMPINIGATLMTRRTLTPPATAIRPALAAA